MDLARTAELAREFSLAGGAQREFLKAWEHLSMLKWGAGHPQLPYASSISLQLVIP
jgi:hypothetical protein